MFLQGALAELKAAAVSKKKASLVKIAQKTGDPDNLVFVDRQDPVIRGILE